MHIKSKLLFGLLVLLGIVSSCNDREDTRKVLALVPIYGTLNDIDALISTEPPKPLNQVGKIYTYNNLLFINEYTKGIHVYDNADPINPIPLQFISIPGNVDIAIKNQMVYADLGTGLATIDIHDLSAPKLTDFDQEYLNKKWQQRPPTHMLQNFTSNKIYFECPDPSKGMIIHWEAQEIPQPECYLNN